MPSRKNRCPNCDSPEFISELNRYDVYEFQNDDFEVTNNNYLDEFKTFCRDCQEKIDVSASIENKRMTLKAGVI